MTKSTWTITYDPGGSDELVLAAVDDMLEEPPMVRGRQRVDTGEYIEVADAEHDGRGGVIREISLRVTKTHADLEAAMLYPLDADAAMPVLKDGKTLRIANTASLDYHDYTSAVLENWTVGPAVRRPFATVTEMRFLAGGVSKVEILTGEDGAPLLTEASAQIEI